MKSFLSITIILLMIFSCSSEQEQTTSEIEVEQVLKEVAPTDTLKTTDLQDSMPPRDYGSLSYIGFVKPFYFTDDKLAYVELYFNEPSTVKEYNEAVAVADSVIYQDEEDSRTWLAPHYAEQYLDLRGIDTLYIYNINNKLIDQVTMDHVELLDESISSFFIAVYNTNVLLDQDRFYYAVGNRNLSMKGNYKTVKMPEKTEELVVQHQIENEHVYKAYHGSHYKNYTTGELISVVNSNEYAVIVSSKREGEVLYKSEESEHIMGLHVIPHEVNGMPLLLAECYLPESDMTWDLLLRFDGEHYVIQDSQRIDLNASESSSSDSDRE